MRLIKTGSQRKGSAISRNNINMLVMTLLVRNEEDILPANIEFHLAQGVDFFIATDNLSTDSTADILKYYEKQGVLYYIYEKNDNYNQHKWVTKMARMAYKKYRAAWVINNDADEFWWPKEKNLKETLLALPAHKKIVRAQRTNFVYLKEDGSTTPFYQNMVYRETRSFDILGKPLLPKVAHRGGRNVRVKQGNHKIQHMREQHVVDDVIDVLHFPMRTHNQYIDKIVYGGSAYKKNHKLSEHVGREWRLQHNEYTSKGNLDKFIQQQTYDERKIAERLKDGSLVKDTRLKKFLEQLTKDHPWPTLGHINT